MATKFRLGAEIYTPTGLLLFFVCLFVVAVVVAVVAAARPTDMHQGHGDAWTLRISLQVLLQLQESCLLHVVVPFTCKSFKL